MAKNTQQSGANQAKAGAANKPAAKTAEQSTGNEPPAQSSDQSGAQPAVAPVDDGTVNPGDPNSQPAAGGAEKPEPAPAPVPLEGGAKPAGPDGPAPADSWVVGEMRPSFDAELEALEALESRPLARPLGRTPRPARRRVTASGKTVTDARAVPDTEIRTFTAAHRILKDNLSYDPGAPVPLTRAEFEDKRRGKAIVERFFDDGATT